MGKGDKKTTRGKRFKGSYGVSRPRKKTAAYKPKNSVKATKVEAPVEVAEKVEETPAKKVTAKKAKPKKATPKKAAAKKKVAK